VRADKLCLAALSATLLHYLKDEAVKEIPIWRMIAACAQAIRLRAQAWQAALGQGEVLPSQSTVGGGSLPGETLPTFVLALTVAHPNRFLARLRGLVPVIARLEADKVVFDPRTVLEEQESVLVERIGRVLRT
jgi:L-seryl-tRNA(Ser) seleniumtransferase